MANGTILWAGTELSGKQEAALRRVVHALRRTGSPSDAECLERFLPENMHKWTPDELEAVAQVGSWISFGAQIKLRSRTGRLARLDEASGSESDQDT